MAFDIMRRTGGWAVELATPIKHANQTIEVVEIRPLTIETMVRWSSGQFPSSLALLAELSGIPEMVLRQISYPDADRVMLALYNVVPQALKDDLTNGVRPMATPADAVPPEEPGARAVDQNDPRFPAETTVLPIRPPPEGGPGMALDMPDPAARRVS
jgi:hypothetical protein